MIDGTTTTAMTALLENLADGVVPPNPVPTHQLRLTSVGGRKERFNHVGDSFGNRLDRQ